MAKFQLELNLQIVELQLKAQPSTPPEVREQCANVITSGMEEINSVVRDCTRMLEESFEVLTTLQEDLNIQRLETKVHKLQQQYDEIKGTTQTMAFTQRLLQRQQAKVLKEQVDAAQHKEEILKAFL